MISNASAVGNGGTRSCRRVSSSIRSSSTRSGRFARFCPSFTNNGPRLVSVSLNASAYLVPPSLASSAIMDSRRSARDTNLLATRAPRRASANGVANASAWIAAGSYRVCIRQKSESSSSFCLRSASGASGAMRRDAVFGTTEKRGRNARDSSASSAAEDGARPEDPGRSSVSASSSTVSGSAMAPGGEETTRRRARRGRTARTAEGAAG